MLRRFMIFTLPLAFLAAFYFGLQQQPARQDATNKITKKALLKQPMAQRKQKIKGHLRADSPDLFYEYLHGIRYREDGPNYPFNYRISEFLKTHSVESVAQWQRQQKQALNRSSSQLTWVERGPANVSGRTRGFVVDPADKSANTFYAGSVGGGVWKSSNGGQSWTLVTPDLGNFATSTIVQAPSNPDVMYVGTGEGFGNIDQVDGSGIWRSDDRGQTWSLLESTSNLQFQNITRLIVDPNDENVVLASTRSGNHHNSSTSEPSSIWKSTDGGQTWTRKYSSGARVEHLVSDPTDFNRQYATLNGNGILRSTDAGENWTLVDSYFSGVGRMEIAIAPGNTSRLYVSAVGGSSGTGSTLYISRDYGQTWAAGTEKTGDAFNWLGGQGWYDNTIAVYPFDEDIVFVGGINIWRIDVEANNDIETTVITDGYRQFGGTSKGVHVDQHNIVFAVKDSSTKDVRMFVCNDGGVSYSDNLGDSFTHTENGYNTAQFYGADKRNGADEYIGGMQDNGTYQSPIGQSADATSDWSYRIGGDGFKVVWNYGNTDMILGGSQYNGIAKSVDGGKSFFSSASGLPTGSGNAPFYTKISGTHQDPDVVYAAAANGIYRSADFGDNWYQVASPDGWVGTSSYTNIQVSKANPQTVWAGRNFSNSDVLFVSKDGGYSFSKAGTYTVTSMGRITGLASHATDEKTAYALFSYAQGPKILRTTDWGESWQDISGFGSGSTSNNGFPDVAVYSLVNIPNSDTLWAGTDIGIFESTDNGESWHSLDSNLPKVSIFDMTIVNDQVVVGTHGRGIWSVTLPQLANYTPPKVVLAPQIDNAEYIPLTGFSINATMRGAYDSTKVYVNDQFVFQLDSTAEGDTLFLAPYVQEEAGTAEIKLVSRVDGRNYRSGAKEVFILAQAQPSYVNDFANDGENDFYGDGFKRLIPKKFQNNFAIHSEHPYPDDRSLTYTLLTPIVVSADEGFMRYRDIALIEPGEPGSNYGDGDFWDYVIVEGAKNGDEWVPLKDGYDARYSPTWLSAYNNGTDGEYGFYEQQEINLLDAFAAGDTILIRFRLYADGYVNGWGWAIDDVEIQGVLTSLDGDFSLQPARFTLEDNYPNPFNPSTTIAFTLPEAADVTLTIYDIRGAIVRTLIDGQKHSAAKRYDLTWDGKDFGGNDVASGTYFYRLQAGKRDAVRKMVLIR